MLPTDTFANPPVMYSPNSAEEDLERRRRLTMELRRKQFNNFLSYFPGSFNEAGQMLRSGALTAGGALRDVGTDFGRGLMGLGVKPPGALNLGLSPDMATMGDRLAPDAPPPGTGTVLAPSPTGTGTVLRQDPALTQDPAPTQTPTPAPTPALSSGMDLAPIPALLPNFSMPVDQFESSTDRKRDRTTFGEFLANRPGMSDRLIRMGSAMQAASPRGLNAAMAAMGQAYADVNAEQREQAQLAAQAELEAQQKAAEAANDNQELNDQFESQIFKYEKALEDFEIYKNVTGLWDGTIGAFFEEADAFGMGDARKAAFRRRLQKIIVDETLLNTANTKGAISDKEMALFKSAVPSLTASEEAWVEWLKARRDNLIELQARLRNGVTVDKNAEIGFTNKYQHSSASPTAGGSGSKYTAVDITTS